MIEPVYADKWVDIIGGECRAVLRTMAEASIHAVVTSPPYFGLRDYGVPPSAWGGDRAHDHVWAEGTWRNSKQTPGAGPKQASVRGSESPRAGRHTSDWCGCGAWRGALGLEPVPEMYVEHVVEVAREIRRVLRPDGTLWLNLGDSFATNGGQRAYGSSDGFTSRGPAVAGRARTPVGTGVKAKDLIGVPWMVAFALRADGWHLRRDVIWDKPNGMPESVTDRPASSHEYLFMLTKSPRYYYDRIAVREPLQSEPSPKKSGRRRIGGADKQRQLGKATYSGFNARWDASVADGTAPGGRNLRSVWRVTTEPYPGAHFATFPRKLVEPCIQASTSGVGVCAECGAPLERRSRVSVTPRDMARPQAQRAVKMAEAAGLTEAHLRAVRAVGATDVGKGQVTQDGFGKNTESVMELAAEAKAALGGYYREFLLVGTITEGWARTCEHEGHEPVPATVLDPFAGSGTTGLVAQTLGRRAVLIDLNPKYLRQALARAAREWGVGGRILEDDGTAPPVQPLDVGDGLVAEPLWPSQWAEVVAAYSNEVDDE